MNMEENLNFLKVRKNKIKFELWFRGVWVFVGV